MSIFYLSDLINFTFSIYLERVDIDGAHYGPYGPILLNSLSGGLESEAPLELRGCITKTVPEDCFLLDAALEHRTTAESRSEFKLVENKTHNEDADLAMGSFYCSAQNTHHHQQTSPVVGNTTRTVNKPLHAEKGAKTGSYKVAKVEAISNMDSQDETEILSRIIQYEQEIGRQPTMLNLLSRFSQEEIAIVWQDLLWLYPSLGETEWSSSARPDVKQVAI